MVSKALIHFAQDVEIWVCLGFLFVKRLFSNSPLLEIRVEGLGFMGLV